MYSQDNIVTITGMGQYNVVNSAAYQEKWKQAAIHSQEAIGKIGNFSSLKVGDFNKNNTPSEFIWRSFFTSS